MSKIYQPEVIKKSEEIVKVLEECEFFKDHEIENTSYAKEYLCDVLTEKFIKGDIDIENDDLFMEDEFETVLKEIVVGTMLVDLKERGIINSYEDDETEEIFFLTEEGKKQLNNMRKDDN